MSDFELSQRFALLAGVVACLLSTGSLLLAGWAIADRFLPREARVGLRLLLILLVQFWLCAVLVQTLGIFGLLTPPLYFAASLVPGLIGFLAERHRRPLASAGKLVERALRVWIVAPRFAVGWLAAGLLLVLAQNLLALPQNMDALSLHGPLVVEWIQSGRVALESHWNYPQVWEYQFAANFLLTGSDLLAIVPGALALIALLLAVRELAQRFRLTGYVGYFLSLAVIALPLLWRDTMKGDPVFALGLLACVIALERGARERRGAFLLLQAALFLVLGAKASGFFYAFGVLAAWVGIEAAAGRVDFRHLARGLAATVAIQISALATQLNSFLVHGNPVYPVRLELGGRELLPGPLSLAGTSVLDQAGEWETWRLFVLGGFKTVGPEWPLLLLMLPIVLAAAIRPFWQPGFRWHRIDGGRLLLGATGGATLLLLVLYAATPWTCNLKEGPCVVLGSGASLRFAIAPICLLYLLLAAGLRRVVPRRNWTRLLAIALPVLVIFKWWTQLPLLAGEPVLQAWAGSAFLAALFLIGLGVFFRRPRKLPIGLLGAALVLLFWAHALRVDITRFSWWAPNHQEVWIRAHREIPPGSAIGNNDRAGRLTYLLVGPRLENRIVQVPLDRQNIDPRQIPADMNHFLYYANQKPELEMALQAFAREGWQLWAQPMNNRGAFFSRSPQATSPKGSP